MRVQSAGGVSPEFGRSEGGRAVRGNKIHMRPPWDVVGGGLQRDHQATCRAAL